MKARITICIVSVWLLSAVPAVLANTAPFNAPGITYSKVLDGGTSVFASASFSPDARYIAYIERNQTEDLRALRVYDRSTMSTTTLITTSYNNWISTPYFNNAGTKIGFGYWDGTDTSNVIRVHNLNGTLETAYGITSGDIANSDFLGSSDDKFVAWDYGAGTSAADLFIFDGSSNPADMTRANITSTELYKEYEPDSTRDGLSILYWSGETTTEPIDTTHLLTYESGSWVTDSGFNPIAYSTWAFWSYDEQFIGLTKYITSPGYGKGDLYIYDKNGNFVLDLTGSAVGQDSYWQFFGFNFKVGSEYLFTSNADNALGGRDIWIAVPEPATICLLSLGALSLIKRKK